MKCIIIRYENINNITFNIEKYNINLNINFVNININLIIKKTIKI